MSSMENIIKININAILLYVVFQCQRLFTYLDDNYPSCTERQVIGLTVVKKDPNMLQ